MNQATTTAATTTTPLRPSPSEELFDIGTEPTPAQQLTNKSFLKRNEMPIRYGLFGLTILGGLISSGAAIKLFPEPSTNTTISGQEQVAITGLAELGGALFVTAIFEFLEILRVPSSQRGSS